MVEKRKIDSGSTLESSTLRPDEGDLDASSNPFPRGGGSAITALEIRKAGVEATRDVYEQLSSSRSKKARSSKKTSTKESTYLPPVRKSPIESLQFAKLKVGTLVLAQISEIKSYKLVLSLPNNLIGFVEFAEEDDDDKDPASLYSIGSWLRATITGLGEAPLKRIQLSIEPDFANQLIDEDDYMVGTSIQGTVTSVEDHGAIVSFGESKMSGFLPTKSQVGGTLNQGQIILATIVKIKGRVYTLTMKPDHTVLETIHQQASLVPGTLVEVTAGEAVDGGRLFSLFGHIDIGADIFHSGAVSAEKPDIDDKLKARVLLSIPNDNITDTERRLALSVLPSTVGLSKPQDSEAFALGQVVENAKVVSVDGRLGLFMDIGLSKPAYVHISRVADERIEDLAASKSYKVNTVHDARVINYSSVDDIYHLSLQPKVLAQEFLRLDQVPVGHVTEAQVDRILPKGGVIFSLGEGLSAIANEFHLSDAKLEHPEKRYKPGQKVTVRVLKVDKEKQRMEVTAKKSLINWDSDIISSLSSDLDGKRTIGTIVVFKPRGAVVEFFGNIKGFLPIKEMSETSLDDPKKHFRLGQSITVSVLEADEDRERLIVSCLGSRSSASETSVKPLEIVSGVIVEKTTDSFLIDLESGRCVLPFSHLTDDSTKIKSEAKSLQVGKKVSSLVVLEKTRNSVKVSRKASLVDAAKASKLPSETSDLQRGTTYPGYIRGINADIGVFVAFANGLVGLVPKAEITKNLKVDQSVVAAVTNINSENGRVNLTFDTSKAEEDSSDIGPGTIAEAVVTAVKTSQLNVTVGSKQGRLEISQVFDDISEIEDHADPLGQFKKGDVIKVKVIGYHDARSHRFLPISHRASTHIVLELTAKKSQVEDGVEPLSIENLNPGTKTLAFINNVSDDGEAVWVNVAPNIRGKISRIDLSTDIEKVTNLASHYTIGSVLPCTVIENTPSLLLTCLDKSNKEATVLAQIHKIYPSSLLVRLPFFRTGFVAATDASDDYTPLADSFKTGTIVPAKVVKEDDKIWVSIRPSVVNEDADEIVDPAVNSVDNIKTGTVMRGFVRSIADGGVFVDIGRNISGRVQISQLSDTYLKDWKGFYKVGQVVTAKVVAKNGSRLELSLKESVVTGKLPVQQGIESLEIGSIFDGSVRKVQEYGVFVSLKGTSLSGLCHKSEVADRDISDLTKVFQEGDPVKVKVLAVDLEKGRISLGMKASYFEDDDSADEMEGVEEADDVSDDEPMFASEDEDEDDEDVEDLENVRDISEDDDEEDEIPLADATDSAFGASGGLSAGFDWSGDIVSQITNGAGSDSESESDDDDAPRRKKKRNTFVEDKTATLTSKLPQSIQDFERLLVANPNSSILWMNYMAFQVQLSEIDAARTIGRRALKTIGIREEDEKFNIWVALINLENSFGTDDSTREVFKEATQFMDSRLMHLKMASIYASSDKMEAARAIYNTAAKKFGSEDLDVWVEYGQFLFSNGDNDAARVVLERATRQLPTRLHKDITLNFAKQEYHTGDVERGRTLFEGLVSAFPKKLDLWNVYIDQEVKSDASNRKSIEALFERIVNLKLNMKQGKQIFKKWLSYEVDHGDTKGQDYVKAKAAQFVEDHQK